MALDDLPFSDGGGGELVVDGKGFAVVGSPVAGLVVVVMVAAGREGEAGSCWGGSCGDGAEGEVGVGDVGCGVFGGVVEGGGEGDCGVELVGTVEIWGEVGYEHARLEPERARMMAIDFMVAENAYV